MLVLISPSKTQQAEVPLHGSSSVPLFEDEVRQLVGLLKQYQPAQLASLMKMSDKLAALNHRRFQEFSFPLTRENSRQALFMFQGDQFASLAVEGYGRAQLEYAQHYLCILSGLYGILRPLDLMQPYRLEMATKLAVNGAANLYEFWGERVIGMLNKMLAHDPQPLLVNLASAEYFKVVRTKELNCPVLTCAFVQEKEGRRRTIAIHAKRARGAMVDFMLRNQVEDVAELCSFSEDGYVFAPDLSSGEKWVFVKTLD